MNKKIAIGVVIAIAILCSASIALVFAKQPEKIEEKALIPEKLPQKEFKETLAGMEAKDKIRVIVTLKDKATNGKIAELQGKYNLEITSKGWDKVYPSGFAAIVTKEQLMKMLSDPNVAKVHRDEKVYAQLETANYWSGATKARNATPAGFGVTGNRDGKSYNYSKTDVVIAILDTGIDVTHVDLNGTNNGGTKKVIGWQDFVNYIATPYDDNGHGTHVASIAAGEGDDNPRYKGVAPGAALVGAKVLDYNGYGYWSWVIDGVNWVVANKDTYGIRIMSLSLGGWGSSDGTDPCSVAINNAADNNILVTVAAGNMGPQKYTISSPGAAAKALTVGAMADPGYLLRALPPMASQLAVPIAPKEEKKVQPKGVMVLQDNGFYLAPFSSRGPTADNRNKPDVVAPGVMIMAAKYDPSATTFHGGYWEKSGTSMSTPFVAGVAALMLHANYTLNQSQLKSLIMSTAEDWGITGTTDVDYGAGRIRAFRAVAAAANATNWTDQWVPTHLRSWTTSINDTTWYKQFPLRITDDSIPFASTLIMYDWSGYWPGIDLDLGIIDKNNNYVGYSGGYDRQETLTMAPDYIGRYNVTVDKWWGSGRYVLDISYK